MKAALVKVAEIIFKRKIWGRIGLVLLLGLTIASIFLVLMNDFLSERYWGLYLILVLGWLVNSGFVFERMAKSEGWMVDGERCMIDYERWAEPLVFHITTVMFFIPLCGLIILNPFAAKYYIPDWLEVLMIIDVVIIQVIIFIDGFCLNKERTRERT